MSNLVTLYDVERVLEWGCVHAQRYAPQIPINGRPSMVALCRDCRDDVLRKLRELAYGVGQ